MRALAALVVTCLAVPFAVAGCKGSSRVLPASLPTVTLPADDMEAGRALGKAAATEKDPVKLAATLVAFLDRLHVPVVSEKGDKLIAHGRFSASAPSQPWFWEPVVVGAARATVLGDTRSLAEVLMGFGHPLERKKAVAIDFGSAMREVTVMAGKKAVPLFGPIAAAIVEDLTERKQMRAHPRLDPVVTLLFGVLLAVEQHAEHEHPLPATPATPSAPPARPGASGLPYPLPRLPGLPANLPGHGVHVLGMAGPGSGGGSAACSWSGAAEPAASSVIDTAGTGLGWAQSAANKLGIDTPALQQLLGDLSPALGTATLAETITDGLAGMGIAAFVTADGDVSPTKVRYGDGPATYRVQVKSDSPFDKRQLDDFVNCLEAQSPSLAGSAIENLRNIPPKGGVANVPVLWTNTDQYDPKHGTFSPSNASVPDGVMNGLVKAGMQGVGGGTTDASGETKATFQVKPKKGDPGPTRIKRYTIDAEVFPFPPGTSTVNAGANALFSREVPLALEIEVPLGDWVLTVNWTLKVMPPVTNMYFQDIGSGTVSFKLDPNDLSFHARGSGTQTYAMPPQVASAATPFPVTCEAPAGAMPVDLELDGRVTSFETMDAEMHLTIKPTSNSAAMSVRCSANGHSAGRTAMGRMGSGTEDFTMVLDDGETKTVAVDQQPGPVHVTGPLVAAVAAGSSP